MENSRMSESEGIESFRAAAHGYCDFIDALKAGKPAKPYVALQRLLADLARTILDLPVPGNGGRQDYKSIRMTTDEAAAVSRTIGERFAGEIKALTAWHEGLKREAEDGLNSLYEADVTRSLMLWDDLADIYRDLMDGFRLYRIGTEDAVAAGMWEWWFGYQCHWGEHVLKAMLTIHEIRFQLCEK